MTAQTLTPAARGPLAMTLHGARYDLRTLRRNPRARFFAMAFPILLLVVLSSVGGDGYVQNGHRMDAAHFFVPGIITMTLMLSCFGSLIQAVVNRRASGVWKRRRAAAVPAWSVVGGQTLANTAMAMISVLVLLLIGRVGFGVGIGVGPLLAVAIIAVVTAVALCACAFAVSSLVSSPDAAQPVVQLIMFPVLFLSGVWFPTDDFPRVLDVISKALPTGNTGLALHQAFTADSFGSAIAPGHLAVLAAWAVGAAALAAWRFDWMPARD